MNLLSLVESALGRLTRKYGGKFPTYTMELAWEFFQSEENFHTAPEKELVRGTLRTFAPSALNQLHDEVLAEEKNSLAEPDPVRYLRKITMDTLDEFMLADQLLKVEGEIGKNVMGLLSEHRSAEDWAWLTSSTE